ncbi:2016_t:CDS:2 [Dentiscutata erythropus]|uniref:2016_t:CDS:1 n=1 Tax=Dentiscutata erythropus TaxID=1348616 RepID=A0A9N9D9J1_9GLOM|nr:2016_t:CDS:2 [Dentiscutata erythropus]
MEVSYTNPTTLETSAKNNTLEENFDTEKTTSYKEEKQKEELKGACNSETKRKREDLDIPNLEDRKPK